MPPAVTLARGLVRDQPWLPVSRGSGRKGTDLGRMGEFRLSGTVPSTTKGSLLRPFLRLSQGLASLVAATPPIEPLVDDAP